MPSNEFDSNAVLALSLVPTPADAPLAMSFGFSLAEDLLPKIGGIIKGAEQKAGQVLQSIKGLPAPAQAVIAGGGATAVVNQFDKITHNPSINPVPALPPPPPPKTQPTPKTGPIVNATNFTPGFAVPIYSSGFKALAQSYGIPLNQNTDVGLTIPIASTPSFNPTSGITQPAGVVSIPLSKKRSKRKAKPKKKAKHKKRKR